METGGDERPETERQRPLEREREIGLRVDEPGAIITFEDTVREVWNAETTTSRRLELNEPLTAYQSGAGKPVTQEESLESTADLNDLSALRMRR